MTQIIKISTSQEHAKCIKLQQIVVIGCYEEDMKWHSEVLQNGKDVFSLEVGKKNGRVKDHSSNLVFHSRHETHYTGIRSFREANFALFCNRQAGPDPTGLI